MATGETIDIRSLLAELRQDHRNMAALLGLLREETTRARHGAEPDFEILNEIMHYMTVYSDAVHHPREDKLYAELAAAGKGEGLAFVESDHREIAADGKALKDDCEAVASGATLSRAKFIADAARYVERLEEHMRWEETDLFRRADSLAESDLDFQEPAATDPLFGPQPGERFSTLLVRVRKSLDA